MNLDAFDFDLPEELIALRPAMPRDTSRLLVVDRNGQMEDRRFSDLPALLDRGDMLVFNETRVLPAALKGVRPARDEAGRDVAVELNLVAQTGPSVWRVLARPGRRLKPGDRITLHGGLTAQVGPQGEDGETELAFSCSGDDLQAWLETHGAMPLPPYIARKRPADAQDRTDYQTVYASGEARSVAAPTAGLHFTPELIAGIQAAGIDTAHVQLTVGQGTFAPLKASQIERARLHAEWRQISPETARRLNAARQAGQRLIPVGTTALRTLESAIMPDGPIAAVTGPTDIFIRPGDRLRATDGLITNFHLPRSSLFMLVCALMGTQTMQHAYAHAIREGYRFYSYGDACLLVP